MIDHLSCWFPRHTMNFVKSSVYQQEITSEGVKEKEIVTRTKEEIALEERLKNLPEFQRQNHFLSFAEVKYDDASIVEKKEGYNPDVPAAVTEEEFEYYEALAAQDRRRQKQRQKEEKDMQNEFLKAKKEMEEQRRQAQTEARSFVSPLAASPVGGLHSRRGELSFPPETAASLAVKVHSATPEGHAPRCSMGARIFDLTSKRKLVTPAQKRSNAALTESPGASGFPSTVKRVRRNGEAESELHASATGSRQDEASVSGPPEETSEPPFPTGGLQDLMGGYSDDEEEEREEKNEQKQEETEEEKEEEEVAGSDGEGGKGETKETKGPGGK
ncbi:UNVERIFIED_CONTAM: hypothetical protein HHA_214340 [Hammondia hammondi]|eukprot:XP_008885366.1 hypothetical protein HHA_214340 [Hammondia hammondi]